MLPVHGLERNFMTGTLMFPKFCALSISTWEPVTLS